MLPVYTRSTAIPLSDTDGKHGVRSMATSVLITKLFIPPPRPNLVPRPRLTERLDQGLNLPLTVVVAPAGFGKTTLVSAWLAGSACPAAWLSLDAGDDDPLRFLTYVVAALRPVLPAGGEGVMAALQAPQPPPLDAILTALLNELAMLPADVALVLDDYHAIQAGPVHDAVAFLLSHPPPRLHLVLTTREEPPLPLARLRARAQVVELHAADLRFTPAEAAAFLSWTMGLGLSAADIAALEARTEGWVAGLQLAALSLQGQQDVAGLIRAFAGDHRHVVDYLVAEVLQRQTAPVRRFLLQTSILDRLHGPLCDAVTGETDGAARLDALERGNVFVVPLDDQRRWYRYHHLFAAVLRARLMAERPDQVAPLHRRASDWCEQHGLRGDAIRHALAAGHLARAADLIELALPAMGQSRQDGLVRNWLKLLPDELIRARPVLSVGYAWALMAGGELAAVDARLRDAERWLESGVNQEGRPPDMVVVDEAEFRRLPGMIALYRAGCAQVLGDLPAAMHFSREVLDRAAPGDVLLRGAAAAMLGLASWASGDLDVAYRAFAAGMEDVLEAGNVSDALSGTLAQADILIGLGRRREAMRAYERAMRLAAEQDGPVLQGTADLHAGVSEIHREQNDLEAARQDLARGEELGERIGVPQDRSRWCIAMARLREAEGDPAGALDLLDEAERVFTPGFFPDVRPVAAVQARAWVSQGKVDDALGWARARGLAVDDDLSYVREFEHITLARLLLARARRDRVDRHVQDALGLLARLLEAADAAGRKGSAIEILIVQALAHQMRGDHRAALASLQRTLVLAEPEGYVRAFVDEGPPMADLLREAAARGGMPAFASRLLAAFEAGRTPAAGVASSTPVPPPLIEPLSQRELAVLRLLATELSGPEIADQLVIGLSTVRTHTKRIYGKLDVTNRRAAVKRAIALRLI